MEVCPAFMDETGVLSGSPNEQPLFGIGLLVIPDPKAMVDKMATLHYQFRSDRTQGRRALIRGLKSGAISPTVDQLIKLTWSTRHHEYKFTEVAYHNVQDYIALLDLYFSFAGPEFHSVIVDRTNTSFDHTDWGSDPWHAYIGLARELLRRRLKRPVFAVADFQARPKRAAYLEDTLCSIPHVAGCIRAASDMSIFLQVVDLLLGCVQFEWRDQRGYYSSGKRNAKRDLTAFVKSRLGIPASEPILSESARYRKREKPSLFTAWWARP